MHMLTCANDDPEKQGLDSDGARRNLATFARKKDMTRTADDRPFHKDFGV